MSRDTSLPLFKMLAIAAALVFLITVATGAMQVGQAPGVTGGAVDSTAVFWTGFGTANSTAALVQNTVGCIGFISGPFGGTFSKVSYDVTTADNTASVYDMGISQAVGGAQVCHLGPTVGTTFAPATGIQTMSWAVGCPITRNTKYLVTITSSASVPAAKLGGNLSPTFQTGNTCGSSTGGAIPNPLNTVPTDSYAQGPLPSLALHN